MVRSPYSNSNCIICTLSLTSQYRYCGKENLPRVMKTLGKFFDVGKSTPLLYCGFVAVLFQWKVQQHTRSLEDIAIEAQRHRICLQLLHNLNRPIPRCAAPLNDRIGGNL